VRCEEEDIGRVGEERSARAVCGEPGSWPIGTDDAEMVREGERVPEGAFIAGRRVAVEIEDGWGGAGGIAVLTPGYGAAVREDECLCWGLHDDLVILYLMIFQLKVFMVNLETRPRSSTSSRHIFFTSAAPTQRHSIDPLTRLRCSSLKPASSVAPRPQVLTTPGEIM